MTFAVSWTDQAEQDLADIWLNASDRPAVVKAGAWLDRQLSRDPLGVGESRSDAERIVFAPPLAARYAVDPKARTVSVTSVWRPR